MVALLTANNSPSSKIKIIQNGDIFHSECLAIVNPVNSIGVMGAGLAAAFNKRYPLECRAYNLLCRKFQQDSKTGTTLLPPTLVEAAGDRWLLMFPTKIHWKNPSEYGFLETNLPLAFKALADGGITSVAFPKLGAGLGTLDPNMVVGMIVRSAQTLFKGEIVEIYV